MKPTLFSSDFSRGFLSFCIVTSMLGTLFPIASFANTPTPVIDTSDTSSDNIFINDNYQDYTHCSDDIDGDCTSHMDTSGSVDTSQSGSYILNYSYTNTNGNTGTGTRTVNVSPRVTINPITTSNSSPALSGTFVMTNANVDSISVVIDGTPYAATNHTNGTWTISQDTLSELAPGTYDVEIDYHYDSCGDYCNATGSINYNNVITITEASPIDLSLTKTLTNTGVIHAGDQVGYRFTITNNNTGSTYTSLANDDNIDFEDAMPDIIDMGSGTSDTPSHVSIDNPVMYCQNYGSFANEYDPSLYGDYQNTHDIYCSLNNDLTIAPGASMSFTMTGTATADFQDGLTNKALWMDWSDPSLPLSDPDMQAIQDAFNAASNSGTPINGDMFGFSGNNVATSVYHVNTVVDTIPPVVTLNGSNLLNLFIGDTFTDPGASWTDDVDGSGTLANASSGSVDTSLSGTYILTYSYTDTSGNTGSTTRTVNVNPVAILPSTSSPQQSGPGGGGGNFTPSGGLSGNPISLISAPFGSPISLGTSSPGVTLSTNKKIKKSKDQLRLSHKIRGLSKNTPDNHTPSDDTSSLIVPTICTSILKLHNLSDIKATDIGYDEFRSSIQKLMMYRGDWTKASGVLPDAEDGIIANTNFFHGTQNITRAEYVTMLVRALGCTYEPGKNTFIPFPDVDLSLTSALYIEYAVSQHWVNGYADGDFRPDAPISRGEAAKILGNAIYLSTHQLDDNLSLVSGNSFQDISLNNEFAKYIYALKQGGILDGKSPSLFGVDDPISRQEVAKIFANVFLGSVQ